MIDMEVISAPELAVGHPSARELVMTYGWNTTAYQILNPGLQHWFAPDLPAVVAYIRRHNVMLALCTLVATVQVEPKSPNIP